VQATSLDEAAFLSTLDEETLTILKSRMTPIGRLAVTRTPFAPEASS
jgi:hypothetical protein